MRVFWISWMIVTAVYVAVLITAYVCYRLTFYAPNKADKSEAPVPSGVEYEPYRGAMMAWLKTVQAMPHREVEIRSFDGLILRGKYYEYKKGAPIEILFHGYKSSAAQDLSGGVIRCFALGHSALAVDHRGCGASEGHVISFGINESRDCEEWVRFVLREISPDATILLTGISMGASTVMMCADRPLPPQVVGIVADCGYTSPREIVQKVIREDLRLPAKLFYPFVWLGAKLYGKFDLEETSPIEALRNSRVPIIFFHGDADIFVPHSMSVDNYNACVSPKRLVTVKGAGHGLSLLTDRKTYLSELQIFFAPILEDSK